MGAIFPTVEGEACLGFDVLMNLMDNRFGKHSACNTRLIRDYNHSKPRCLSVAYCLGGTGDDPNFRHGPDIVRVLNQHAVAVKEDGGAHTGSTGGMQKGQ